MEVLPLKGDNNKPGRDEFSSSVVTVEELHVGLNVVPIKETHYKSTLLLSTTEEKVPPLGIHVPVFILHILRGVTGGILLGKY